LNDGMARRTNTPPPMSIFYCGHAAPEVTHASRFSGCKRAFCDDACVTGGL
jgi:hypothetical protein